ncbi:MAG: hypothetical protein H3C50_04620 [Kiritimatiellae bacterium]|nr:hypothetical protein [Kiritimatiellia bacterium]MCO5045614.1 hypothetical protein [Kiritimatiellia bacterium]MCO5069352.1 hypothetical protein [Kiritimatiellia bacterium]
MYELVFKCRSCATHLSASADDSGYEFDCPTCGALIAVPSGDILFSCPQCNNYLLATHDAAGDTFDCPHCQRPVLIPMHGKEIPTPERPHLAHRESPSSATRKPPETKPPTAAAAPQNSTPANDLQFMTTWGDYLATAGLTGNEKKSETKKNEASAEQPPPPHSPPAGG